MYSANEKGDEPLELPDVLPVLPLKDAVLFPYIIVPLSVTFDRSLLAVDQALASNRLVMLTAQQDPAVEEPSTTELYDIGTAGMIMRMLKLPDGRIRILVQGLARARLEHFGQTEPFLQARIVPLPDEEGSAGGVEEEALIGAVKSHLEQALQLGKGISPEVMVIAANLDDPGRLADLVASNLELQIQEAQDLLECLDPMARLVKVNVHLHREIHLLRMQHEISSQAREEIDRSQREFFLRQQIRTIQQELGEVEELAEEIENYRRLAKNKGLSDEASEELDKQIKRLERSHPDSAENAILRTYLDWLTDLPWTLCSDDDLDIAKARQVLDEDHYDLEAVKDRIIEFLAVRKLKSDVRGPILCFVGPPGVGKTSLGRSIARSLGRRFVRISLGGVRDEAEIRGHRRTYVGAMPGRILQGLYQAGTNNPVFMLDEIDKIGSDFRGDPSSALLEVLDPEQNHNFRDHYLGVPYDLSKVMFIATANLLDPIQPAFLDRLEVLHLSGYTEREKIEIAKRHLIPKQLGMNGLRESQLQFSDLGLEAIIRGYTREAGLRNLEREIGAVCRKIAVPVAQGKRRRSTVTPRQVERHLGPQKHFNEELLTIDRVGVATGLAWTSSGGDLMFIEVLAVPGEGKLLLTGRLGEVMKESAQAALSYARTFAERYGYPKDFFTRHDIHIHAPAGSIPKDGPSAGITIATAIVSTLTGIPIDRTLAMTGEITLRGDVMPIGGLKEKALAARAAGIRAIILPKPNRREHKLLPESLRREMTFHLEGHMDRVIRRALTQPLKSKASGRRAHGN